MKKSLLAVMLAAVLAVPVFAQKGDMSVNAKLGLGISNNFNISPEEDVPDGCGYGVTMEMPFSLGAEFFYEATDGLSLGFGVNYTSDSDSKFAGEGVKLEAGTTNIYLAVKPEAKINSEIFSSLYLIGQIGLSMVRFEIAGAGISPSVDSGLYLGFGAGTVIKDVFLVELICSSSNGKASVSDDSVDLQYTATTLNIGYKFAL